MKKNKFLAIKNIPNKIKSEYFQDKENAEKIIRFGWLLLFLGIISLFSLSFAFASYALMLYLISLVSCIFCPCIGITGITGTTYLWYKLLVIDIYIAIIFLGLIAITGLVGTIYAFVCQTNNKRYVIISGIIQIVIVLLCLKLLSPLFHLL